MSKIFDLDFRKGTLIDSVSGTAGTNYNGEIVQAEKGLAWKGNSVDSYIDVGEHNGGYVHTIVIGGFFNSGDYAILAPELGAVGTHMCIRINTISNFIQYQPFGNSPPSINWNATLNDGKFHSIIITRNQLIINCYIDNVPASVYSSNLSGGDTDELQFRYIGKRNYNDFYFDGYLTGIQIYNEVLGDKERTKLYKDFVNSYPIHNVNRPSYIDLKPKDLSNEDGLVAAYNMVPQGDTLVDISGNGYNGTIYGAVSTKDGMFFDGNSSYVDCGYNTMNLGNTFSINLKLKTVDKSLITATSSVIQKYRSNSRPSFEIGLITGINKLRAWFSDIDSLFSVVDSTSDFDLIETVSVVVNGTNVKLYVNGELEKEINDLITIHWDNTYNFYIGKPQYPGNAKMRGNIKDVRLYNRALTAQEIKDYHNSFAKQVSLRESFSDDAVGKQPLNWDVQSGSFSVQEMTTQDSVLKHLDKGTKYLQCDSVGKALIQHDLAFFELEFDIYNFSNAFSISFIANDRDVTSGYTFACSGGELRAILINPTSFLFKSASSYVSTGKWYGFKIKRDTDGTFYFYIRGDAFGEEYVLIDSSGYGSNPVTDNTHTTSNYFVTSLQPNDRIANIKINKAVKQ